MEVNKNIFAAVFILFIVFAVHPAVSSRGSIGRLKLKNEKVVLNDSEILYEIDYRGPETHSYRPPPNNNAAARGNSIANAGPLQNPNPYKIMHAPSKRLPAENKP